MPIRFERRERLALITIDRPEALNALDLDLSREMAEAWITYRDDPELWVAIVTGAGEKAFSTGADLKSVAEFYRSLTPVQRRVRAESQPGLGGVTRNLEVWKPIIAAVNGYCFGGGLELALACDLRIASDNAQFGLTETSWGIIPGAGGTQRLPRLVPAGLALEMILTAKKIDAAEAYRIGLVNQVVLLAELMDAAMEMASRICTNAPLAIQTAKLAVWKGLDLPLADGLRLEQALAEPLRQTEDAQEGLTAFLEKRQPQFKGS
ncbi:MAG: enoyl-CoA hydratase-related protein [Ardenticatenaceae bacterium]|nr:enoyl-CoA hydratase-related protein [Ardenticatenaceae bacterium]HBY94219.1 enoyl-CoA hydratase [Chloroflexota bacterium]